VSILLIVTALHICVSPETLRVISQKVLMV